MRACNAVPLTEIITLADIADTIAIPEYTEGMQAPYYTYNDETRELKIYLTDITGSDVGTTNAIRKIIFYVQVDVEHPIFTDSTYSGYLGNAAGTAWTIPNTAYLSDNYLSGADAVKSATSYPVLVQHLSKKGTAYKNGNAYSIDYSLAVNRIQQQLPETAVITDNIPAGMRLDASTVKLYEATVISPDMFHVIDNGTIGTMVKGAEIEQSLYSVETVVNDDGTTTMHLTLPQNSGTKMYIAEYSCDVTDVSKAPFTNSALIEGVKDSGAEQTITKIQLNAASGGGTMLGAEKTNVYVNKTDSVSGVPVQGAVFGVYYKGVLIEKKATDAQGTIVFENLNKGMTYTVTELSAASGYLDPVNVTDTFVAAAMDDPTVLRFENTPKAGAAQFIKTDDKNVALPGAQFGVWANAADITVSEPLATITSSDSGLVTFTNLTAGKTYYIAEISAPAGFQKSNDVIVAKMNMDGELEKLWLLGDSAEIPIMAFANSPVSTDSLTISKTVTGNLGDRTAAFDFSLTIKANSALAEGSTVSGVKSSEDGDTTVSITVGMETKFTLKHGETLKINGLTVGTEYTIMESDYTAENYTTSFITTKNGASSAPIAGRSVTNTIILGGNAEAFTNTASTAIPTGLNLTIAPYWIMLFLVGAATVMIGIRLKNTRRKNRHG